MQCSTVGVIEVIPIVCNFKWHFGPFWQVRELVKSESAIKYTGP